MSYYYKAWTEERIERLYKEGRGRGAGAQYRPLLEVHDVPSLGLARRAHGVTTGRVHHLLSNVEFQFFLMLDWAADVDDIREQYPINRELTQDMALTLRIKHPCYPGTNVATLMSVDFLVDRMRDGERTLEAFDIKRSRPCENSWRPRLRSALCLACRRPPVLTHSSRCYAIFQVRCPDTSVARHFA